MIAVAPTYQKGRLYTLDLSQLQPDPNQPRKSLDPAALEELAASIAQHGVLEPILFRLDENGGLIIVAGERRVQAARQANLTTVPGILVDGNHAEIALVENLLRQDLTAIEEAEALGSLMTERSYTQEQLAGIIGKARTTLNEILSLNRLPVEIRDECRGDRAVSRATLLEIARKKQTRSMLTAYNKYKEQVRKQQEGRKKPKAAAAGPEDVLDWLEKTGKKLSAIDTTAYSDEQKAALAEALASLQATLESLLHSQAPTENQPV
jgi:ParB family chromosome partitioning protein